MKTTTVTAYPREDFNKATTKKLRKEQNVPGAVYSDGKAQHIYIGYKDAKSILFTKEAFIVELEIDGAKKNTIVREAQYHPVTDKILHVDLMEISDKKKVEVVLPLRFVGTPKSVTEGGILMIKLRTLRVKGIPSNLPDHVDVDITALALGSSIKVSDLELEEIDIITNGSTALAGVEVPRALKSATATDLEDDEEEGEEGAEGEATEGGEE